MRQGSLLIPHKLCAGDSREKLWLEEEDRLLTVALVGSVARGGPGEHRARPLVAENAGDRQRQNKGKLDPWEKTRRTLSKSLTKRLSRSHIPRRAEKITWQQVAWRPGLFSRRRLPKCCRRVCASAAPVSWNPAQPLSAPLQAQQKAKTLLCNATERQN